MKTIRFGLIGCGLMGKEFAAAASRWCHLNEQLPAPEIVAVCATRESSMAWFTDRLPGIRYVTTDYRELLRDPEIDAIYCAVPHVLHRQMYIDIIESGKHLLGEKPFGMNQDDNTAILEACRRHPEVVVRCASEFPFYPACQMLIRWVQEGKAGRILEVNAGFNHSSDLDTNKKINWKRQVSQNGEYGCMGDLGIHTQHVPFRMGWIPKRVYADLRSYVSQRPDGKGGMANCDTWDNATLLCSVETEDGQTFPMTLETKRMMPGATNSWYLEVLGMDCSMRFSTDDPNAFCYTQKMGTEQAWCRLDVGNKPQFPTATGGIFEFGFSDCMLQMWTSFIKELLGQPVDFGCFTPEETVLSHALQTAALRSHREHTAVTVELP